MAQFWGIFHRQLRGPSRQTSDFHQAQLFSPVALAGAHYEAMGDLGLSSPCADSKSDSKDLAVWAATSGGKAGRRRPWFRAKTRSSMTTQAPKSMPSTSRGLSWDVF